jgi:hypothetical protein
MTAEGGRMNGATGMSDIDGRAATVAESEWATSESMRRADRDLRHDHQEVERISFIILHSYF